ncbi:putative aarF domain-containing protein kinase [Trifolium pratense]|uniref:Putative aarF domain-containing protein kinase n=1 Tax=Trifolium pratense TaxID=57577 RepID=A0A2K3P182_TRIPR|nr:putative aarF domain-containing protein kinase [Trifolium pratense]
MLLSRQFGSRDVESSLNAEKVRNKVLESRGAILSLISRGVEIVLSLGLYWSALVYDFLVGRDEEVVPFRARQLRNLLCDLGPSFIKAGQVLANRPDIIREDYMSELCILQDDVPSFPNEIAFSIIEEELGQPLEAVFSRISSETIAAASLGQVYRATLRATGEDVAIKVQRPEIEPIIYRDLFLFRTLASFLNGISIQKLGCNAELIVDEFGEKLLEELDYTLEARNIEDFLENFKDDPTVKIPMVYKQLSGPRVLVMEWIDGIRCTNPQAIKEGGIDLDGFLTIGVSAALRQLLEFGLFHGDPHPGNIFAMRDGRIAYVDFGNVAVLSQVILRMLRMDGKILFSVGSPLVNTFANCNLVGIYANCYETSIKFLLDKVPGLPSIQMTKVAGSGWVFAISDTEDANHAQAEKVMTQESQLLDYSPPNIQN